MGSTKPSYKANISVEVAPYWNVNTNTRSQRCRINFVEVAPYWNVNQS